MKTDNPWLRFCEKKDAEGADYRKLTESEKVALESAMMRVLEREHEKAISYRFILRG